MLIHEVLDIVREGDVISFEDRKWTERAEREAFQYAQEHNLQFIDISAANVEPQDFEAETINGQYIEPRLVHIIRSKSEGKPSLIFFSEMNRAKSKPGRITRMFSADVEPFIQQFLNTKKIGRFTLPKGWIVTSSTRWNRQNLSS